MTYYVWHDEGCCDNKTDDLEDARRIEKELLDAGYLDAYITNSENEVVDETYVESSFCERRAVALMPQSTDISDMDDWYFEEWVARLGHVEYIRDQHDLDHNNIHPAFFVSLLWHPCVL